MLPVPTTRVLGILFVFAVLGLTVRAMPTRAQDSSELTEFVSGDIRFVYPTEFTTGISETAIEAIPPLDPNSGDFRPDANPAYTQFTLEGFVQPDSGLFPPTIRVYATADFEDFTVRQERSNYGYGVELDWLNKVLDQRPDPALYALERSEQPADLPRLPYLPFPSAGQLLRTNIQYVPFDDGWGVRYITYFNQAIQAILDQDLLFTFQGVTNDGSTYITISFPIRSNTLPTLWPDDLTMDYLIENYPAYVSEITAGLNAQADANFTPSLTTLDDLILSLSVNGTIDYVPMPEASGD